MGPKEVHSTVLTKEEEAAVAAFRKYTLLPLDDCLYALQPSIPHLTRSSLHPWTNGQVGRMNRTIMEATVRRYYYQSHTTI